LGWRERLRDISYQISAIREQEEPTSDPRPAISKQEQAIRDQVATLSQESS